MLVAMLAPRACALVVLVAAWQIEVEGFPKNEVFTNSFLVRFRRDMTLKEASGVANVHGFINLGKVSDVTLSAVPRKKRKCTRDCGLW